MDTAVDDLMALLRIPGAPGEEAAVAEHLEGTLLSCGVPAEAIRRDKAFEASEYGGQCGNLIVQFPAAGRHVGPARLFSAHMDTIPLAAGCRPRFAKSGDQSGKGGRIVNDAIDTALGGDNRTGCAVLLHVARMLAGEGAPEPRPPVVLVFFVQEEVGLVGSRQFDVDALGVSDGTWGFNFDGGRVAQIVTRVIGTSRFKIDLRGVAAHAGAYPGSGVSAAVAAAHAIASLDRDGWHGRIEKAEGRGSANIGTLQGGTGTNVVMDRLEILAEVRSHDAAFRDKLLDVYKEAFGKAASQTKNRQGRCAEVSFADGPRYESFALEDEASVVAAAVAAVKACGLQPTLVSNDGGMDANHLNAKGVPTVTFGVGQHDVHAPGEWIDLEEFLIACRLASELVTAGPC
ncbi:MAG TPA: M20/M25/M40 family metallo-hydrolase [Phycisphaerae bacterium]|nr:M20/M25/M40 family metallo-hydrolase [Phycisphaerae bacterium]